jgi:hypothetical protein
MKYLVYNSCSLAHPHYGVQLEHAERLLSEGHDVVFSYCDGVLDSCFMNPKGNKAICKLCKFGYTHSLSKLSKGIEIVPLKKSSFKNEYSFNYNSVDEMKSVKFKDSNIGLSTLSTYISLTRNPNPIITPESRKYFNHIINDMVGFTTTIYNIIEKYKIDAISIYSGRFYENRPFYDIATSLKLNFVSNEIVGGAICNEQFYITSFENSLPTNLKTVQDQIIQTWNYSKEDLINKKSKGESFFLRRRKGLPASDRVYISNQIKGRLPSTWDKNKRNFVIFNSSEDEFAGLGGDFEQYSLFKTQIEGIKFMLSSIHDDNTHFYLRIHPNLKNISFNYHSDLYLFEKQFSNITIIRANEDVSTYDIMDAADRVIVFGSTMGVEACYWGKPVILLSGALYYFLDCCYLPSSTKELLDLLIIDDLKPKDRKSAIKYGYYLMDREVLPTESKYFDLNFSPFFLFGLKINTLKYMTLFGSPKLMKIVTIIWFRSMSYLYVNRLKMPDPVFND